MKKTDKKTPPSKESSAKADFAKGSSERSTPKKAKAVARTKPSGAVRSSAKSAEKLAASSRQAFPIVGVGASAGGLEAFTQFLKHLPADTGMGFVLVQHLDPEHESALTEILSRATAMPVLEVTNGLRVQPNHIYVIPPNACMEIGGGVLKLQPRNQQERGAQHSIDSFFESLARDRSERAIGVVLSGTASDGTLGLEAIKAEGGITFAQDESAKFDSMPRSAIAAGCVDFVLSPAAIAKEVARIAQHPLVTGSSGSSLLLPPEAEREADQHGGPEASLASGGHGTPETGAKRSRAEAEAGRDDRETAGESGFKKILLLLRNHCGVDFSLYKSSTIQRRIARRMVLNRQNIPGDYAGFLRGNAKELDALYSDVLISVTSFFRNAEAFEALKRKVFPALMTQRGRDEPMRVWTLGCSTGQEAYSIAMSFAEFAEKLPRAPKLQIFATDLNEALLEKARHGLYAKTLAQDLSPERLRRFFIEEEGGYRISKALREQVVFARQNVMSDPPFSRMDLISCRNLLIYFEAGLQKKIMPAFHYALKPGGFLFLGASESVGPFTELFEPADKKQKIFVRKAASTPSFRLPLPLERSTPPAAGKRPLNPVERAQGLPEGIRGEFNAQREADRLSVSQFAPPGVLIDAGMQVMQFRGATGAYLEPPVGKASFDLLKMAREGLMLPLRAAINQAKREKKTVRRENVRVRQNGTTRAVNLQVIPLKNLQERCYLVLFEEAKAGRSPRGATLPEPRAVVAKKSPASTSAAVRRVAELERELSETRDYLQSIQEQFEASTEELQASSEEVQSANEELQSINEELETSKEELESTNEELTTVNEEMANRNLDLNSLNNDLNNLHVSIDTAILVLGRDLTLRRFTVQAEKIFNLLATDVGRPLSGIRHNLDCRDLEEFVREVIDTVSVRQREVRDKEGHWYSLRARPYLTNDNKIDGAVLVLVDIDALKRSEDEIKKAQVFADAILQEVPPLLILENDLRVVIANESFYEHFKVSPAETERRMVYDLGDGQWQIPKLRTLLEEILPRHRFFDDFEITHEFPGLGRRTMLLHGRQLDSVQRIVLRLDDVTERLKAEAAVKRSEIRYRRLFEAAKDGILILDPVTRRITDANPFMTEFLGYSFTEFVGKELWQIGLLRDEEANREAMRELQERGTIRYENLPLKTKAGEKREVEFVSNLYDEDGQNVIQCNIRDITERKASERALEASEKRLAAVLEQLPVGVCLFDPDGRIILKNSIMGRFIRDQLPSQDPQRDSRWSASTPEGLPLPLDQWPGVRALRGETVSPGVEFLFDGGDGRKIWTTVSTSPLRDLGGAIVGAVVMVEDINGRKEGEASLRQSRLRVTRILESITDSFYVVDAAWRLADMNAAARKTFTAQGVNSLELIGKNFWESFPATLGTRLEGEYRRVMEERVSAEFDYYFPSWERWFSVRVYPIEEGGLTVYFHDITESTLANAALLQGLDDLRGAQSAAERGSRAKDDFLAALSHELRTPLTPVLMAAAALGEDERLPADVREQLGMMERNIALEARLIDDLLDLTTISRGKLQLRPQLCDAHSLIGLAIEIVREDARSKEISIERVFAAHRSGLIADPARFQQVIWNLLRNAVKFTPRGGSISVHTRDEKTSSGEHWLRIEVTDSGIGIEPALLDRIFLPFDQGSLTGDHRFGGIGLGLAIARAVVDLHKGRITAQSAGPNRGATFVVELPGAIEPRSGLSESAPPFTGNLTAATVPRPAAKVPIKPLRLLLVEDHASTLQTVARLLRRDGHEVVAATNMAEALTSAAEGKFDLVISDLGLPDGTGTELMEKLRDAYRLRGVALSGYGMEEDLARSRAAGFLTHLVKPVSISELRRVIASLPPA